MGYTHYWYRDQELDQANFGKVVIDFIKIIPTLEHLGVKLGNGLGENKPVINIEQIWFNGLEKCDHTKRELGLTWPSKNAQGIATGFKQNSSVVDESWFAGLVINSRVCSGSCAYETFSLERIVSKESHYKGNKVFSCTKTNYYPYDLAVNVCLIIAKHHLKDQIIVMSDGELEQWQDAIQICDHFLGYGSDFKFEEGPKNKPIEKPKPEAIIQTPNNTLAFKKAKEQALKHIQKRTCKTLSDWDQRLINQITNLINYPISSIQLKNVGASAKAIIIKAHLKELYPQTKFSIYKTSYNSLTIKYMSGVYPYGLEENTKQYSDYGNTDLMTDYFDIDTYIHYDNELTGDQHFYKSIQDAKDKLEDFKRKKECEQVSYYDVIITHLENLVKST